VAVPAPSDDPVRELFASSSVAEHVARGVVGLLLAVASIALASTTPWALLGLVLAGVAWRGCPTCWTLGLVQTLGRASPGCVDGSCRAPAASASAGAVPAVLLDGPPVVSKVSSSA